jgi:hypothetical protein
MKLHFILLFNLLGLTVNAQEGAAKLFAESLLGLYGDKSEIQADTVYIYSRYINATWQIVDHEEGDITKSDTIIFYSCYGSKPNKVANSGKEINRDVFYVLWKNPTQTSCFWVKKFDSTHSYEKTSVLIPPLRYRKPNEIFDYTEKHPNRFFEQGTFSLSDLHLKTKNFTKDISGYIPDKRRPENNKSHFVQVLQDIELSLFDAQNE